MRRLFILLPLIVAAPVLAVERSWPPLGPDNIVLIVNKNAPESTMLAYEYSQLRGIPRNRTVVLDVTNAEDMDFDLYERRVVPTIRKFLIDHHLRDQTTCLLTFMGVPFRIRAKVDTSAEKQEYKDLVANHDKQIKQAEEWVGQLESLAKSLDPAFLPRLQMLHEDESDALSRRALAAMRATAIKIDVMTDLVERRSATNQLIVLITDLKGAADFMLRFGAAAMSNPDQTPEQHQHWVDLRNQVNQAYTQIQSLEELRYDADARAKVRQLVGENFGLLDLLHVEEIQMNYLQPDGTTNSALDNELALLWWDYYPRGGPYPNPLNYKISGRSPHSLPPTLMVSRLDAPNEDVVKDMIETSVRIEQQGLQGDVAINSYHYPNSDSGDLTNPYKQLDHSLRNLAAMTQEQTKLTVHQEYTRFYEHRELKHIALYCGWYSLRDYRPGMVFASGAVGYHIASFEMLALHNVGETGWVHGLLNDGVVGTLGPVAEPYLWAFPRPDEFFPLLMTGKLTLAEVYWRTEAMSSWMTCLIGDPLYNPYKVNPAMRVEDLPAGLRNALGGPTDSRPGAQ
jgi:uncharacterized protein (TIGR03790 family)